MRNEHRTETLTEALAELAEARVRYNAIGTWNTRKRDAAEDVEFWSNRVAFLEHAR